MGEWLEDPEAPWWAKLRRAQVHINEVRQRVDALQSAGIWSIEREPAADGCSYRFRLHRADGWAYRFRINRAVPADLLAAVGDAVANMRSALDYVAYELARHTLARLDPEALAAAIGAWLTDRSPMPQPASRCGRGGRQDLAGRPPATAGRSTCLP